MPKTQEEMDAIKAANEARVREHSMARMESAKALLDTQKDAKLALGQSLMEHGKQMLGQHSRRLAARGGRAP